MVGKIVRLEGIPGKSGFEVLYGFDDIPTARHIPVKEFSTFLVSISFGNLDPDVSRTYIKGGHVITDRKDGFKDILIFNNNLSKEDNEDYLLVIIPYASQLISTSKKLAGRYYYYSEAVLEMYPGDTVTVSKSFAKEDREVFMVVQAGNELFLIKKTR